MREKRKTTLIKKFLMGIVCLFFIGMVVNCGVDTSTKVNTATNTSDKNKPPSQDSKESKEKPSEEQKEVPNWNYSEDEDKMSGEKRFFASTRSTNKIDFEFPYNGGSTFKLNVRNMGKGDEVLMMVSKGQFMPSIMDSEKVRIRFDEESPLSISYNSAADGSGDVIFFNSSKKIINKLKTSKKVMVEAPFFGAGRQIVYFNVEGFKWEKNK